MALSGVRSSWLMLARNCDLCLLAISSSRPFSSISRNRRAFWIASTDWSAKVSRRSTVLFGNSRGRLRYSFLRPNALVPYRGDHCRVHAVGGTQIEFLTLVIEHVNRTGIGLR